MRKTWKKPFAAMLLATAMLCAGCGNTATTGQNVENEQSAAEPEQEQTVQGEQEEPEEPDASGEDTEASEDPDGMAQYLEQFSETEKQSEQLKDSIDHDDLSQTDYNLKTGELYQLWDQSLNDLWKVLESVCGQDQIEMLRDAQADWIAERDRQITDAGKEAEGGSMQPMLENMAGARLTEARVRELMQYLPGYEETDAGEAGEAEQSGLFQAFLKNEAEMTVSDQFVQASTMLEEDFQAGKTFKLEDVKAMLAGNEWISQKEPVISSTVLRGNGISSVLSGSSMYAYAISLQYDSEVENMTQYLILLEQDGKLTLCFAIDGWSRRYPQINENGVVFDSGSNGAGSHGGATYVPDRMFVYHKLIDWDENYYGFDFYDEQGNAVETVNAIMKEAGEGNEDAKSIAYTRAVIDGEPYYYYLGEGITQEMVDYIDGVAAKHDFTFDGKDKVDQMEAAYAAKLGAEEIYLNQAPAEWQEEL